jgi:alpha-amylase
MKLLTQIKIRTPKFILLTLGGLVAFFGSGCSRPTESTAEKDNGHSDGPTPLVLQIEPQTERWWHDSIFYEIWPRSFKDSDGDGHGDFRGMTEKLDYLADLGIDGIWLTPIFEAPSYHGYDFVDFFAVEEDYGTMEDFEEFLAAAQARGMKVILDLVINHISDKHAWFLRSAAGDPAYADFFLWETERPADWGRAWEETPNPEAVWHWNDTRQAYYYGAFGPSQPDINLENPTVREEINKLATFWLEKGVDGFRLDAVRYALEESVDGQLMQADSPGTIAYWTAFTKHVASVNPEAKLIAEAWADMPRVALYNDDGKGLHSAFDFDFGYVVTGLLNDVERSADFGTVAAGAPPTTGREALWQNLLDRQAHAPMAYYAPFLTNHDQVRVMHALGGDFNKARIAASLLFASPGCLYLYYGEEIGLSQYTTGDDTYKRAPMPWDNSATGGFNTTGTFWIDDPRWVPWMDDFRPWWSSWWEQLRTNPARANTLSVAAQQANEDSLWHHYRRLIAARRALPALSTPTELRLYPVAAEQVYLLEALREEERALVIVNLDPDRPAEFTIPRALRGNYKLQPENLSFTLDSTLTLKPAQALFFEAN